MSPCCVEGCTSSRSSRRRKDSSISFHVVPAKDNLRAAWLRILSKHNPSFAVNDFSAVCSLHFTPSDFKQNTKLRRLLPNAIPSIFPKYPTSFEPSSKRTRLIKETPIVLNTEDVTKSSNTSSIVCTVYDESRQEADSDNLMIECSGFSRSVGIQVSQLPTGRLDALKRENNVLRCQHQRLKESLKSLTEKLAISKLRLDSSTEYHKVVKLKESLDPKDIKAKFLIEQIFNFDKYQPHWSESTLQECLAWRNEASKGYEHARTYCLISLPSRCTLERYIKGKDPSQISNLKKKEIAESEIVHTIYIKEDETKIVRNTPKMLQNARNLKIPCSETINNNLMHAFVIQNITDTTSVDCSVEESAMDTTIDLIHVPNFSDVEFPPISDDCEMLGSDLSFEAIASASDYIDDVIQIEITPAMFP